MKLIIALIVAVIAFGSWDMLAQNGKYRRAVGAMAGHITTAFHLW